jgi:putative restriction endonuclease
LGGVLEYVQSYCLEHDLPPLSALVVNKSTGLPSEGFVATKDVPRAFIQIFDFDWGRVACPTPEELAQATQRRPSNGIL